MQGPSWDQNSAYGEGIGLGMGPGRVPCVLWLTNGTIAVGRMTDRYDWKHYLPSIITSRVLASLCIYRVHQWWDSFKWIQKWTRMHSSRMGIVRCSGRRGWGGVYPGRVSVQGVPSQGVSAWGVSAQRGYLPRWGVSAWGVSAQRGYLPRWGVSA